MATSGTLVHQLGTPRHKAEHQHREDRRLVLTHETHPVNLTSPDTVFWSVSCQPSKTIGAAVAHLTAATQFMTRPHREPRSYFKNIHQTCYCSPDLTITLSTSARHVSTRRSVVAYWPVTAVSPWPGRVTQGGELTALHRPSLLTPGCYRHTQDRSRAGTATTAAAPDTCHGVCQCPGHGTTGQVAKFALS